MDLRPKIAAEIVEAILDDLGFSNPDRHRVRARWTELALSKIVSHDIEFPKGEDSFSSGHPEVVEAFLTKYPKLRQVVADCTAKGLEIEPNAKVVLEVRNDPEGCHTCREGQSLLLEILLPGEYDDEYQRKKTLFSDWWIDYPDAFGPERDKVFDVFHPMCGFLPDSSA